MSKNTKTTDSGAAAQDERIDREVKLRRKLGKISLKEFRVKDLNALMRLQRLHCCHTPQNPTDKDLKLLEKRAEQLRR